MVKKTRNAVGRGAVGCIVIMTPEDQQRYAWNWFAPLIASGGMNWVESNGVPHDTFPAPRGAALLSQHGAALLFAGATCPAAPAANPAVPPPPGSNILVCRDQST